MHRSFDIELMKEATHRCSEWGEGFNYESWMSRPDTVMLVDGKDVGCAVQAYPGVYTVHWFFTSRGRKAMDLATKMGFVMFDEYGAKLLRGLTPENLKGARWLAKQLGWKSQGFVECLDPDTKEMKRVEVMTLLRADLEEATKKWD